MGATIIVGKTAAAYRRTNGEVIYFLFENTYEKNCHPHTPHWSCTAIGGYEEVMHRVLLCAASCEGGMLQGRGRPLTPEGFIRSFQSLLRRPVGLGVEDIYVPSRLAYAMQGEQEAYRLKVASNLSAFGLHQQANDILSGCDAVLSLDRDMDAIRALSKKGGGCSPWSLIKHHQIRTAPREDLGAESRTDEVDLPAFQFWRLCSQRDYLLGTVNDGPLHVLGASYAALQQILMKHLLPLECRRTGAAVKGIAAFRNAESDAPFASEGTLITIDLLSADGVHEWQREMAVKLADRLAGGAQDRFTTTLGSVREADLIYELAQVAPAQIKWAMPSFNAAPPHDNAAAPLRQLSLL